MYAFKASSYPLILSLEVHCNVEQQTQMASIIRSVLGEYLVDILIKEDEVALPSPAALMNKILIKVTVIYTIALTFYAGVNS